MPAHRLVLLGRDNPHGSDPHFALYPRPDGCAGHRLFLMIEAAAREAGVRFTEAEYVRLDRRNLLPQPWAAELGRRAAVQLLTSLASASGPWTLLGFGVDVRDAVLGNALALGSLTWTPLGTGRFAWAPHPSGRNRTLNNLRDRSRCGRFVWTAIREHYEDLTAAGEIERPTMHVLEGGLPLCGFSNELPRDWPTGHRWTERGQLEQAAEIGDVCLMCKTLCSSGS